LSQVEAVVRDFFPRVSDPSLIFAWAITLSSRKRS